MLSAISLRDFVLAPALDLAFDEGFTALTGETGSGKSLVLAALGYALGGRGPHAPVRTGADAASVSAVFEVGRGHPVRDLLAARGVEIGRTEPLTFRRTVRRGQAARGFLNDQPVSAALMQAAGALLVDLHGQHESVGLGGLGRQRALLDGYARAGDALRRVQAAVERWRLAREARLALEAKGQRAQADIDYLDHALAELGRLAPEPGEAAKLALERASLQSGERTADALDAAATALGKCGVEQAVGAALRALARALSGPAAAGGDPLTVHLASAAEALDRTLAEWREAEAELGAARSMAGGAAAALEAAEARLFALRAAGRKHQVDPDQLADVQARLAADRASIEDGAARLLAAEAEERAALAAYREAAAELTRLRRGAAERLGAAVMRELGPLKLESARFVVDIAPRAQEEPSPQGDDEILFQFAAAADAPLAPLGRTASGGETARLSLAIAVCAARATSVGALVLDEADIGLGGAAAAAVGERLMRLGRTRQVLAVTHSPQVAAMAGRQLRIQKAARGGRTQTQAVVLAPEARREEIARMLAGARVTEEARAAADRLLAGG